MHITKKGVKIMIKCKNGGCPKQYDVCCHDCTEYDACEQHCQNQINSCDGAEVDTTNQLEVFQTSTALVIKKIADICTAKKKLEDDEKKMKEELQLAMEKYQIKSFDNDVIKVTYVAPTTRTSIDSAKLKKEYPDVAEVCTKSSEVKASVRIEVK